MDQDLIFFGDLHIDAWNQELAYCSCKCFAGAFHFHFHSQNTNSLNTSCIFRCMSSFSWFWSQSNWLCSMVEKPPTPYRKLHKISFLMLWWYCLYYINIYELVLLFHFSRRFLHGNWLCRGLWRVGFCNLDALALSWSCGSQVLELAARSLKLIRNLWYNWSYRCTGSSVSLYCMNAWRIWRWIKRGKPFAVY